LLGDGRRPRRALPGIRARGIEVGEIAEINERTRKAEIVDPDGNRIGFGKAG
jgi:hypothetical protein